MMQIWRYPPENLTLNNNEIHVWRVGLNSLYSDVDGFYATLSSDEQRRANAFRYRRHRNDFIIARGVLRDILSRYLHMGVRQHCFSYNAFGKPALALHGNGQKGIQFNLSHSRDIALYGFVYGKKLGIDIEYHSESTDLSIAGDFFAPEEVSKLFGIPKSAQREAFFNCWVRKEAFIKARGEGFSYPLDNFEVAFLPGEPASLVKITDEPEEARGWSMIDFSVEKDYSAALVVEGQCSAIKYWRWQIEELD